MMGSDRLRPSHACCPVPQSTITRTPSACEYSCDSHPCVRRAVGKPDVVVETQFEIPREVPALLPVGIIPAVKLASQSFTQSTNLNPPRAGGTERHSPAVPLRSFDSDARFERVQSNFTALCGSPIRSKE